MMHVGTSGFNYPEWRGTFYPEKLPAARMLTYYAERFSTVEINYTFYRLPTEKVVDGWAAQVPESFSFTLKAPRRITHDKRLVEVDDTAARFFEVAMRLGPRLATLLFQLPPTFKKDPARLDAFLSRLPRGVRAAFEFRHESWWDDEVYTVLRAHGVALCVADSDTRHTPLVATAEYGYLRLRDEGYSPTDLARWATDAAAVPDWREVFVYFKHEAQGLGPAFAATFRDAWPAGR
jgi:uncharacterized protein YecE (DUF72 family)